MDYKELVISVPKEKVDLISTFLVVGGYDTFEVCDYSDIIENADKMFSDYIEDEVLEKKDQPPVIKFYADMNDRKLSEISEYIKGICLELGWKDVFCAVNEVLGSDCDIKWKKYFFPFPVGEKLFVKPSWEKVNDEETAGRKIIEIDPAAAFGSGTHATTKLCLENLERKIKEGDKILDMGAGSGILGIGAYLLGAGRIEAVDIDEAAVKTCRDNFIKNNCAADRFKVFCGNVLDDEALLSEIKGENDIILANIVAQVICLMSGIFFDKLRKGGLLIASGILSEREEEVKNALVSAGFELISSETLDEWVCLTMQKP